MKLLTVGNPKTAKGEKKGYLTAILHLAPSRMSGFNVCPMATKGCEAACLNTACRGGMIAGAGKLTRAELVAAISKHKMSNTIQDARIRKTLMFFNERDEFMAQPVKDIQSVLKIAAKHSLTPVIRLNGTSDIRWESMPIEMTSPNGAFRMHYSNIMERFKNVQFYDYTKIANRVNIPKNYHLTFSLVESNDAQALVALNNGMNVAVVFRTLPLPKLYRIAVDTVGKVVSKREAEYLKVINGDESDLRFLDPKGVFVGLKAKGKGKKDSTGFVKEI